VRPPLTLSARLPIVVNVLVRFLFFVFQLSGLVAWSCLTWFASCPRWFFAASLFSFARVREYHKRRVSDIVSGGCQYRSR